MTVRLTWIPGAGATSQAVYYRVLGTTTWILFASFNDNTTTTVDVTGLSQGTHYDFRVANSCDQVIDITKCSYVTNLQYSLSAYNPAP